jgi:hypothetical protein
VELYCVNERVQDSGNMKMPTGICDLQLVTMVERLNLIDVKWLCISPIKRSLTFKNVPN